MRMTPIVSMEMPWAWMLVANLRIAPTAQRKIPAPMVMEADSPRFGWTNRSGGGWTDRGAAAGFKPGSRKMAWLSNQYGRDQGLDQVRGTHACARRRPGLVCLRQLVLLVVGHGGRDAEGALRLLPRLPRPRPRLHRRRLHRGLRPLHPAAHLRPRLR